MSGKTVAYLVKRFPRLSETFVLNEILEVRRQGIDLRLYALLDPQEKLVHPTAGELVNEVGYLNLAGRPWRSRWRLLWGAAAQATARPAGFAKVAWALLSVHRSMPSVRHAVEGLLLARELRRQGVTHLHAHFAHSPTAVAYLARLAGGPPFSFTAHAKDLYTTLPRNIRIRAKAARFVLTCTDANGRHLQELLEPDASVPIHVVHHGTDLERFDPARRRPEPGLIVSVGRLVPKKGFSVLVDALSRAADGGLDFHCEVYGGGPMRAELEARVRRHRLGNRLSFHGARPMDDIVAAYSRAMVFVLAPAVLNDGDRDGIPNVLVEAMAAGVPVVSTNVSGIPELIVDGECGLLVEPANEEALAAAIRRVLEDPGLAARLASAGRRKVENEFDMVANSRHVAELLAEGAELTPRPQTAVVA
jgi:glycosyltransferase involved in cell wall biosynthesis